VGRGGDPGPVARACRRSLQREILPDLRVSTCLQALCRETRALEWLARRAHTRPGLNGLFGALLAEGAGRVVSWQAVADPFEMLPRIGALVAPSVARALRPAPTAADCYRFVLSHPAVHACLTGPANDGQMAAALEALDRSPMDEDELARIRRHGDLVYARRPRRASVLSSLLGRR